MMLLQARRVQCRSRRRFHLRNSKRFFLSVFHVDWWCHVQFTRIQPARASCVPSSSSSCCRRLGRTPRVRGAPLSWPPVVSRASRERGQRVMDEKKRNGARLGKRRSRYGVSPETSGGLRTLAALRAAFFSCFSLSMAAMISIWVGGLFSRFCAFPLLRIPWPNSTPCCGEKRWGGLRCVSFSEMTGCRGTVETRGEARDATVETGSNRP